MARLMGSSPLTRGKRRSVTQATAELLAHPRSRGENPPPVRIGVADPGSSPLTRGKLAHQRVNRSDGRLIPAHAGKTDQPFQ